MMLLLLACLWPLQAGHTEEIQLRVLIYNIHHGEGTDQILDLDRVARVIRDADADVVLLQEIDRNLSRTKRMDFPALLAEALDMKGYFEPNLAWDGGEYGNATFTNLPVTDHENIALPNPHNEEPRGALRTTVTLGSQSIDIWNTHFGLKSDERRAQAEALASHLREVPSIVGGDLNEVISHAPLRPLLDLLRSTAAPGSTQGTVPAVRPLRRIDHLLVSPHFDVVSDEVIRSPETAVASDHLPCLAVLKLVVSPSTRSPQLSAAPDK
jgi:endonuclease/exonuclease/phosphatase family metal-dependent hydrolase